MRPSTRVRKNDHHLGENIEQMILDLKIVKANQFKLFFDFVPFAIVLFTTFQASAQWSVALSFDPLYLTAGFAIIVSMLLTRNLFEQFPQVLLILWRRKIFTLKNLDVKHSNKDTPDQMTNLFHSYVVALQEKLGSSMGVLCGISGLFIAGWLIWLLDENTLTDAYTNIKSLFSVYSLIFLIRLSFLIAGFVGGAIGWRIIVVANAVSQIGKYFDLDIQVNHPDGCGGLKPIGDLCLTLAYIVSPFPILLSLWLVFINFLDINSLRMSPENIEPLASTLFFLVIPLAILGLFSFFLPLGSIHSAMLRAKSRLQAKLDSLTKEIHQISTSLLTQANELDPKQGEILEEKMEFLKRVHTINSQIPTWPYRNAHLRGLLSTQIIPTIGVISSIIGFIKDLGK